MNVGIIVEDDRDGVAYSELIRKIQNDIEVLPHIPCHGLSTLKATFVKWLRYFDSYSLYSQRIDKVLVIVDSDCSDAAACEEQLRQIHANSHFVPNFPVYFHATKCELESWLLADEDAVNQVASGRGKPRRVKAVKVNLESHRQAKEMFIERLSVLRLPADIGVYREVAAAANIARVAARCPSFQRFTEKVRA